MATTFRSPGVYIIETDTGARPIQAVGTSTAGFVGTPPRANVMIGEAVAINNWSQFKRLFMPDDDKTGGHEGNFMANAVRGFFSNGGSRCYVAPIAEDASISGKGAGLDALDLIDEIAILAAPGRTDIASYRALIDNAERMKDRVAILDGPSGTNDVEGLTRVALDAAPKPKAGQDEKDSEGGAGSSRAAGASSTQKGGMRPPSSDKGFGAFYYPWLRVRDAVDPDKTVSVPPSGHMAGVWARTDAERGVHKAPANVGLRDVIGLDQMVARQEQEILNPAGVNCIMFRTRDGIRVWGARTLAPQGSVWIYLNVRRLFSMIEESIANSTQWVVFEPNDRTLWKTIERDINAFLNPLWRYGALAGARPEDAFFVKCDEETNPPEEIDMGRVTIEIGIAPVKPAEFVIFRIGQTQSGTSVET